MSNCLFEDRPTSHRILLSNVKRVVHARYDHEGNFVRFVVHRTPAEIAAVQKSYGRARVGVLSWFEVFDHNFLEKP